MHMANSQLSVEQPFALLGSIEENTFPACVVREKWSRVALKLKATLGEDLYSSWFARMEVENFETGVLVLSVPTRFLRNWVMTHYCGVLTTTCETEFGKELRLEVRVRTRGLPAPTSQDADRLHPLPPPRFLAQPVPEGESQAPQQANGHSALERGSPLDPTLTFDRFRVGASNALAHAAAERVANAAPHTPLSFNPLYIHSSAGFGKTHLLNAVAWQIKHSHEGRRVLFITAERFMYYFLSALKTRDVLAFKDYFQNIDVLIIDDFQFLQGKTMQQEFCHTFNSLVDSKRQVIVAADVAPTQLESIDQRMRSRLAGGLVVDIEAPDAQLRCDILRVRLAEMSKKDPSLVMSQEVLEYIAHRVIGGGRELEGALNRIVARRELTREPVTIDLVAIALKDFSQAAEMCKIRIEDILKIVGQHYNVGRSDLLSARRAQSIVLPRQIAMYLAKKMTPRSLPEIGRRVGRDHSTVLHAVRKIETLMEKNTKLSQEISLLMRLIEQQ